MWRKPRRLSSEASDPLLNKKDYGGATVATSINSDDERRDSESIYDSSVKDNNKPTTGQVIKSTFAILIAIASACAAIVSFMLVPEIIVYVAGSLCLMNFPMVTYKEKKILFLTSRKKTVDRLEDKAELLRAESDYLEDEIEYLLGYMSRYGDVEQELQELSRPQGYSVDDVVELVRINEETMDMMRENLRQKVIQDVIMIVIQSDKYSHKIIDRVEAKLLALKISVKLEAYGVTFDEDKFLQAVALNPTLWGVASTVKKLLPPVSTDTDGQSVEDVSVLSDKNDIYDMFYMSREDNANQGPVARETRRQASLATRRTAPENRQQRSFTSRQI